MSAGRGGGGGRVHVDPGRVVVAAAAALTRLGLGGAGAGGGGGGPARHSALGPRPLQVGQGARGGGEAVGGVVVDQGRVDGHGHVDVDRLLRGRVLFVQPGGARALLH